MDHLRAALASEPSGRDLLAAAEQQGAGGPPRKAQPYLSPSGPLRDRRWFVLRDTALAWYNTDDDHTLQAPPKVPPRSLRQPRPPPDRPPPPGRLRSCCRCRATRCERRWSRGPRGAPR